MSTSSSQQKRKNMLRINNNRAEKDDEKLGGAQGGYFFKKYYGSSKLINLAIIILVFAAGIIAGIISTSQRSTPSLENYYNKIHIEPIQSSSNNTSTSTPSTNHCQIPEPLKCDDVKSNYDCMSLENMAHPKEVTHDLSDQELLWRASLKPRIDRYPFKRVPKVAFMFLTRGPLPLMPLWEKFFAGHQDFFSIYVHTKAGFVFKVPPDSVFFGRQIPSKKVSWGDVSLADAEKRLLANALLDFSNERFVLLSESCIPVYNFQTVYKYLTESSLTFVESYDDPTRFGRGRYDRHMRPYIVIDQWRKGAQWFEINRALGIEIISDSKYYYLFRKHCHPPCFPDEHYIATYLNIFHATLNSNRTVTWVDWSFGGPHPTTFVKENITEGFIQNIRNHKQQCLYNWKNTSLCYLFARKFDPSTLEPLLNLSSKVMGF